MIPFHKAEGNLYRVTTPFACAGIIVRGGVVISTAPILRNWVLGKRLDWLKSLCKSKGRTRERVG